jgi:hypothetical protein
MATIQDLIDSLQYAIQDNDLDPDTEIVGVFQPNYPLQTGSFQVYVEDNGLDGDERESTVYIGLGEGYDYSTSKVYNEGELV